MKPANPISPFLLAAVAFVAVALALAFTLGRQPPGAAVGDAAEKVAGQTAKAKPQESADAKAQSDTTRRIINHAISATVFEGAPMLQ